MRWKKTPQAATPHHRLRRSLSSRRSLLLVKQTISEVFIILLPLFIKKQKRFYKTFDSSYKTSNIVYNVLHSAMPPIMHIRRLLQFNFSARLQQKSVSQKVKL